MTTPNVTKKQFPFSFTSANLGAILLTIIVILSAIQLGYRWTRAIHIISGFVWYAMLIFLVVIFLPVINRFSDHTIYEIIGQIVPRIFHTVSISGFIAVILGWYNVYFLSNGNLRYFYRRPIDIIFTISIIMVTLMYCFHLFLESSEINVSSAVARNELEIASNEYLLLLKGLRITPRIGFIIITVAIIVMFIH